MVVGNLSGIAARHRTCHAPRAGIQTPASSTDIEDQWISQVFSSVEQSKDHDGSLQSFNAACLSALKSTRLPTSRNEEYRFTDLSELSTRPVYVPEIPEKSRVDDVAGQLVLDGDALTVVVVDGVVTSAHADEVPAGVYVGGVAGAPQDILKFSLGNQSRTRGGPFATLNGAIARDCAVVYVPENCELPQPVHIISISTASRGGEKQAISAPRVLVFLEAGAKAEIVEELVTLGSGSTASMSVTEIELDDTATLVHKIVELENDDSISLKSTLVSQGTESAYNLTEVRVGGRLTRHDLGIVQLGKATQTTMKHFLLCGENQLHDLHSKLLLDHPEGVADQLHKCIATSSTAQGVFDGNVRVNRMAQQTDAQQLSRNLLLVPRATVNVKPNLQIVADDVKCTHGCAVSDLEEDQLFYLRYVQWYYRMFPISISVRVNEFDRIQ